MDFRDFVLQTDVDNNIVVGGFSVPSLIPFDDGIQHGGASLTDIFHNLVVPSGLLFQGGSNKKGDEDNSKTKEYTSNVVGDDLYDRLYDMMLKNNNEDVLDKVSRPMTAYGGNSSDMSVKINNNNEPLVFENGQLHLLSDEKINKKNEMSETKNKNYRKGKTKSLKPSPKKNKTHRRHLRQV
jgi:hypothetical protein